MKISNDLVEGVVEEVLPKIFCVFIDDSYQRSMLFCKYQEFYESPFKEIRGKTFTLEQYMSLYRQKNNEQVFTYPKDWSGFNIPSNIIQKGMSAFSKRGWGPYDEIMSDIWYSCENYPLRFEKPRTKWYLIGSSKCDLDTMKHEIAHGLYYTNKEYKKNCDKLLDRIKARDYKFLKLCLMEMGYADDDKIISDEIQAFMSTGLYSKLKTEETQKYTKKFIENFKNFYNEK